MDLNRLISGIAQSGLASGLAGGVAGGALSGALMSSKKGRIFARVETLDLSGPEKALLFDELAQPARIERLPEGVHDTETAVEVYAASLLAIDAGRPEARAYLEDLAEHLGLPAPLVREIHAQATSEAASRVRAA